MQRRGPLIHTAQARNVFDVILDGDNSDQPRPEESSEESDSDDFPDLDGGKVYTVTATTDGKI